MVRTAVVGIDVGTSGCKSVLVGDDGTLLATFRRSYPTFRDRDGAVTQDPHDWLAAVERTVRGCAAAAGGRRITALGITAPAHNAVLLDSAGVPLQATLLMSDARPDAIAAALRARIGSRFFRTTYVELTSGWTFPQLVWIRRARPMVWRRLRTILVEKDFIRFALTGELATDASDAAGTALYDQRRGGWSEPLLREAAIDPEQLPPIRGSLEIGGELTPRAARRLGLTPGIPVAIGATDTAAELVSVGAVDEGAALVKIASTGTVVGVSRKARPDRRLLTYPHALPGRYYTLAATNTATTALGWLARAVLNKNPGDDLRWVDAIAREAPPGSDGLVFLPFLDGERSPYWDRSLRGAFLGLSSIHRRPHLVRALLEGIAFALRDCRDVMREDGFGVARPYFTGGGMASEQWRAILASVLGTRGVITEAAGPSYGAALIAAAAAGVAPAQSGLPRSRPSGEVVRPVRAWVDRYDSHFAIYRAAVRELTPTAHRIAATS